MAVLAMVIVTVLAMVIGGPRAVLRAPGVAPGGTDPAGRRRHRLHPGGGPRTRRRREMAVRALVGMTVDATAVAVQLAVLGGSGHGTHASESGGARATALRPVPP